MQIAGEGAGVFLAQKKITRHELEIHDLFYFYLTGYMVEIGPNSYVLRL